jgi:hypothetical protein
MAKITVDDGGKPLREGENLNLFRGGEREPASYPNRVTFPCRPVRSPAAWRRRCH